MIVAGFAGIKYSPFALRLAPVALAGLIIDFCVIAWLYHARLNHVRPRSDHELPAPPTEHRYHLIKSAIVAGATLVLFAMGSPRTWSRWAEALRCCSRAGRILNRYTNRSTGHCW